MKSRSFAARSKTPPPAWERIAVTGKARAAIRRATRDALRRQYLELGRRLVKAHFTRAKLAYDDARLEEALPRLATKSVDEVLVQVGRGEIPLDNVLKAVAPDTAVSNVRPARRPRNTFDHGRGQDGWFNLARVMGLKFYLPRLNERTARTGAVPVRGMPDDLAVRFDDSGAVPGDRIVGVLLPGEGIRIFQIHSPKLSAYENADWIDVTWDIDAERPERFKTTLNVTAANEPGSLARIAQLIGENDANIDNLRMLDRALDFTVMRIEVEVWHLEHLTSIMAGLRNLSVVSKVERIFE